MNVTCPRCETTFSLPVDAYVPGRKARCSQCKNVFTLPEPDLDADISSSEGGMAENKKSSKKDKASGKGGKKSPKKSIIILVALVIVFAGLGYGGFSLYKILAGPSLSSDPRPVPELTEDEKARLLELERSVSRIALEDVRQFVVKNEKLGDIVVVHGRAINGFDSPKELISVEVRLFDNEGRVIAEKQQVAGVTLTRFQLSMLSEREFEEALNNKIDILTNNVNVPPNGAVPFVIVFPEVPKGFVEFEVRPIAARDVEAKD